MPTYKNREDLFKNAFDREDSGVMLKKACSDFASTLKKCLNEHGEVEVAQEIEHLLIPYQSPVGDSVSFNIQAYAIPRPTLEQRKAIEPREEREIDIDTDGLHVNIEVNTLGLIDRLSIFNSPNIYNALISALKVKWASDPVIIEDQQK